MEVLKNKKYLGIAGLVFLFLGAILPFFKIEYLGISKGVALLKYWEGYLVIISVITGGLIIFNDELKDKIPQLYNSGAGKSVEKYGQKAVLGSVAIAAFAVIYAYVSVRKGLAGESSVVNLNDLVKCGLGFYSSIIGLVCLAAYPFIYKGAEGAQQQNNGMGAQNAWQPQQQPMMNQGYGQPMQQDPNMMNQQFAQPQQPMQQNYQQPMQQNYQQPMQQDPNMNNNQFPNNNQF